MAVLWKVYGKNGRDATRLARPYVVLCQWRAAVARAVNLDDEGLVEHCRELGFRGDDGGRP